MFRVSQITLRSESIKYCICKIITRFIKLINRNSEDIIGSEVNMLILALVSLKAMAFEKIGKIY